MGIFGGFWGFPKSGEDGWRLKIPSEWRRCSKNNDGNPKSLSQSETFQKSNSKKYFLQPKIAILEGKTGMYNIYVSKNH